MTQQSTKTAPFGLRHDSPTMPRGICVIALIGIALVLVSGCIAQPELKPSGSDRISQDVGWRVTKTSETLIYVSCLSDSLCALGINNITEQGYKIQSIASYDGGGYGSTTAYFVVVQP